MLKWRQILVFFVFNKRNVVIFALICSFFDCKFPFSKIYIQSSRNYTAIFVKSHRKIKHFYIYTYIFNEILRDWQIQLQVRRKNSGADLSFESTLVPSSGSFVLMQHLFCLWPVKLTVLNTVQSKFACVDLFIGAHAFLNKMSFYAKVGTSKTLPGSENITQHLEMCKWISK